MWSRLAAGAPLADGDWVRTAEDADALLRFTTGDELAIAPGSTVIVEKPGDGDRDVVGEVSVRRGSVRAVAAANIVVGTPDGKKVRVRPAKDSAKLDYRISVRPSGAVELAVERGRAEIETRGKETITVASGETRQIAAALPGLDGPPPGSALDEPEARPSGELAGDTTSGMPGAASALDLPDAGADTARSAPVTDLLLSPADGAEVQFDRNLPLIVFAWTASESSATYRVRVSRTSDLDAPVLDEPTELATLKTRRLGEGTYHWGVFAVRGGEEAPVFTTPHRLSIVRTRAGIRAPRKLRW